jgi:O-antigen/teichoic acid export membrane protein
MRSVLSLGGAEIIARLIAFLAVAHLTRQLGPAGFGLVGFAIALNGYFAFAVSAGFNDVGAREIARAPDRAATLAVSSVLVRLGLAALAYIILASVVGPLGRSSAAERVILLTGLSLFTLALDTSWVYKGLERNRAVGFALVLNQIMYAALVFLLVRGPNHVTRVPLAQLAAELVGAMLLLVPLLRNGGIRLSLEAGLRLLRSSGYLVMTRLSRMLILTCDVVLLGFILGAYGVGLYTAAYRVCFLLLALAVASHVAYLPALTRAAAGNSMGLADAVQRSIEFSSALGVPLVIGGIVLAEPILSTLFGQEFTGATMALRILLLSIGVSFVYGTVHNLLLVRDQTKVETRIMATAAALNIALNLVLIPYFGIAGAAAATLTAEALVLIGGVVASRNLGISIVHNALPRSLAAGGVMTLVLLALGTERPLFVTVPAGGVVYLAALAAFGGIPRDVRLILSGPGVGAEGRPL